jgi:hypothetical protein
MKLCRFILVLSISFYFANTFAADFECKKITGSVRLFSANQGKCPILKKKVRRFPDLTFLHELGVPQACFVGQLIGTLGQMPILGKVVSGVTVNNLNGAVSTAASAIKIFKKKNGRVLGRIFSQDTIFDQDGNSSEYLVMTGGTKRFKGGKGHLVILGNVFLGAPVSGTLCLED